MNVENQTLLLAVVVVIGAAVVLQTLILLGIYLVVRNAARSVREQVEELRSSMMPLIFNSRELLNRLTPKVESAIEDLSVVAKGLKQQSAEVQLSIHEILDKVHQQTDRVDRMCTSVLDGANQAGNFVVEVIGRPVRQAAAVLTAVRAALAALRTPLHEAGRERVHNDENQFV